MPSTSFEIETFTGLEVTNWPKMVDQGAPLSSCLWLPIIRVETQAPPPFLPPWVQGLSLGHWACTTSTFLTEPNLSANFLILDYFIRNSASLLASCHLQVWHVSLHVFVQGAGDILKWSESILKIKPSRVQVKSSSNLILLGYIYFLWVELEEFAANKHCLWSSSPGHGNILWGSLWDSAFPFLKNL